MAMLEQMTVGDPDADQRISNAGETELRIRSEDDWWGFLSHYRGGDEAKLFRLARRAVKQLMAEESSEGQEVLEQVKREGATTLWWLVGNREMHRHFNSDWAKAICHGLFSSPPDAALASARAAWIACMSSHPRSLLAQHKAACNLSDLLRDFAVVAEGGRPIHAASTDADVDTRNQTVRAWCSALHLLLLDKTGRRSLAEEDPELTSLHALIIGIDSRGRADAGVKRAPLGREVAHLAAEAICTFLIRDADEAQRFFATFPKHFRSLLTCGDDYAEVCALTALAKWGQGDRGDVEGPLEALSDFADEIRGLLDQLAKRLTLLAIDELKGYEPFSRLRHCRRCPYLETHALAIWTLVQALARLAHEEVDENLLPLLSSTAVGMNRIGASKASQALVTAMALLMEEKRLSENSFLSVDDSTSELMLAQVRQMTSFSVVLLFFFFFLALW